MSFGAIVRGLVAHDIAFVVIGGVAAAAHGSTRVTNDLDICYDAAEWSNVARLAALLAAWDAYPRGVEPGLPFFMDRRTLRTSPIMTLDTAEGALDVLDRVEGVGTYPQVRRRSTPIAAFGTDFRVLDLPALIDAKRAAARPRDLDQLPELEALLALRREGR